MLKNLMKGFNLVESCIIIYLLIYLNNTLKIFSNLGVIYSILILYIFSLACLLVIKVFLTFLYKITLIVTKKKFLKNIKKGNQTCAENWLKFNFQMCKLNVYLSPNIFITNKELYEEDEVFRIKTKNLFENTKLNKIRDFFISSLDQNFIVCLIYIIYKKTDFFTNLLILIKNFINDTLITIPNNLTTVFVSLITNLLIITLFLGERNNSKDIINKYNYKNEEKLLLKLNKFCRNLDTSYNNLSYNISNFINKYAVIDETFDGVQNDVKINNLYNLEFYEIQESKTIVKIIYDLLIDVNFDYFSNFCLQHMNFIYFYGQLSYNFIENDFDTIYNMLFNTKDFIVDYFNSLQAEIKLIVNDYNKKEVVKASKRQFEVIIFTAFLLLYSMFLFNKEFKKYIKIGYIEKNIKKFLRLQK